MPSRSIFVIGIVASLAIFASGCSKVDVPEVKTPTAILGSSLAATVPSTSTATTTMGGTLPDFAALVDRYGSAVVNISVVHKAQKGAAMQEFRGIPDDDPFFQFFFRRFGPPDLNDPNIQRPPERGMGSGFIISSDGYILTNAHVVGDAERVTVKLTDRREFPAKVIGSDSRSDVAVIKIDAKSLPIVRVGQASAIKPGQWVVAIGSPFGFENSVTAGIVSSTSRSLGAESYIPFIQTDVSVNPGNSGGPLFNLNGEVVGINSQIYTRSGGYMGLSFAIPIDYAMDIQSELIKTGHVRHGRIGVTIQDVNAQLAKSFGLESPKGALVNSVENKGPGEKAGIKAGDIILRVNDKPIDREFELPLIIANLEPGKNADITVWRNGRERKLTVRIGEFNSGAQQVAAIGKDGESGRLGLQVRSLNANEQQQAETDGKLVVVSVSGPAEAAGIRPGDVVLAVNGEPVDSVDELKDAVARTSDAQLAALLIERQGTHVFIPVEIGSG